MAFYLLLLITLFLFCFVFLRNVKRGFAFYCEKHGQKKKKKKRRVSKIKSVFRTNLVQTDNNDGNATYAGGFLYFLKKLRETQNNF